MLIPLKPEMQRLFVCGIQNGETLLVMFTVPCSLGHLARSELHICGFILLDNFQMWLSGEIT